MFKKKKETEVDITSLNNILKIGSKLINIGYFMAIFALVILVTYLLKEWKILLFLKELLIVISPIFIGLIIAWLFDPLVRKLQTKKIPRLLGCIISYIIIIGIIVLICYMFIPSFTDQIKEFVKALPDIIDNLITFVADIINKFDNNNTINT